ncbi:CDP-alcohol phosphatidyltransferase family protein [Pseudolysinimonas sp.]|uniref:CDP-alcohol phosphatidyltransferase family protein n=1 Tax=Pseudolysinimonas sp. TaxID=2680009 RepID=UPI003F7EBEC7
MITPASDRIVTAPNVISLARLVIFAPLFVILLLPLDSPLGALIAAAALGATDWVDGYVARRFHQVSELGRKLDAIADRLSQIVIAVAMVVGGYLPWWLLIAIMVPDLVFGIVVFVRSRDRAIPVRWIGRVRTAILMVGMPLILLFAAIDRHNAVLSGIGLTVVLVGTALHIVADALYTWTLLRGTAMQQRDAHPVER